MKVYLTDNGRALCEEHLGASARFTGRDLSGQSIYPVTAADVEYVRTLGAELKCETCGALPSFPSEVSS